MSYQTISPSDSVDLAAPVTRIWVGSAGDVAITDMLGQSATFKAVPAGWFHPPVRVARVLATGTTADHMIGA